MNKLFERVLRCKFSMYVLLIFVMLVFFPVPQILILYLNSVLLLPVITIFGDNFFVVILCNAMIAILFLIMYYRSSMKGFPVFSGVLSIIFLFSFFAYLPDTVAGIDLPYPMGILMPGIFTGMTILIVECKKNKR